MKTARFLRKIANRLGSIGRFIEARDCNSHAVLLWRSLVAENANAHTPELARQLGNLGISLSNLNQHEESLDATEESMTLYRSLQKNPSYAPDLGRQLSSLGISLSNLNRHEESLRATQESITLYLSLVDKNPPSYTPYLARQLGSLGVRLSNLNQPEESLRPTQHSITLYRSSIDNNNTSSSFS